MKKVGLVLMLSYLTTLGAGQRPPRYCVPGYPGEKENSCACLQYHPDKEFCKDENAPLPSCCKAAEKDSKIHNCACCPSGSKKKLIDVFKRGWYYHDNPAFKEETEYDIR